VESTAGASEPRKGPRFHYVIVDYLCERVEGNAVAGSDVTDLVFAGEDELDKYNLTETAKRILKKAFAKERLRQRGGGLSTE
jgi:ADP-ribose pyrophosphatase YjhB (NUDIX family)